MLHELLHAVTASAMFDFYENPDNLSDEQKAAIGNLDQLANQFLGLDFSNEDANAYEAAQTLKAEMVQYLAEGDSVGKTAALQEFVSWTLTNQNLADSLKTTKVRTPLKKLVHKALQGLRRLLGMAPGQSLDMFSNIQWNTAALIRMTKGNRLNANQRRDSVPAGLLLNQVSANTDSRLQRLMERFEANVASHLRDLRPTERMVEDIDIHNLANRAVNLVTSSGFDLDPQQASAFRSMQAAMASSMDLDKGALLKAQEIFTAVTKGLTVESLMKNQDQDSVQDPNDRAQAQDKFNLLIGKYGNDANRENQSNIMATFLALSQIDPELRAALKKVSMPKNAKVGVNQSLDENLENMADNLIMGLSNSIIGGNVKGSNANQVMDRLTDILSVVEKEDRSIYEVKSQQFLNDAEEKITGVMAKGGTWLTNTLTSTEAKEQTSDIRKILNQGARIAEGLVNKEKGAALSSAVTSLRNTTKSKYIPDFMLKLVDEIQGITDENRSMYELMNPVKSGVSRIRQQFRKDMPKVLAKQFSRKLTAAEWGQLHLGLAKTDLAALGNSLHIRDIRAMLTDKTKLKLAIKKAEEELSGLADKNMQPTYLLKAKDLAKFMVKREIDADNHNLARNAEAIARNVGEQVRVEQVSEALISSIDRLTSLYALDLVDPAIRESISSLAQTETKGLDYVLAYMVDLRAKEVAKAVTPEARLNGYKGYVPAESKDGVSLKVANDSDHNLMVSQGYTRMGDYKGSGFESGRKGYYFSTVGGHSIFNQGIMQTVQNTSMGVDRCNKCSAGDNQRTR